MVDRDTWRSGKVRIDLDGAGRTALTAPGYHRPLPYPVTYLEKLASAYPGPALVEELLLAEEPGRFAIRAERLLGPVDRGARFLHWGAAALGATVAVARLGFRIDAADTNPLYAPLARERLQHVGLASRIEVVPSEPIDRSYDALILVGEPVLRPTLPTKEEIAGLLRLLRPDGRVLLLGWPRAAGRVPLAPTWLPVRRPDRRFAWSRLLRPRGKAPTPTLRRRTFGFIAAPLALVIPSLIPRFFGEEYGVFQQASSK